MDDTSGSGKKQPENRIRPCQVFSGPGAWAGRINHQGRRLGMAGAPRLIAGHDCGWRSWGGAAGSGAKELDTANTL